MKPEEIKPNTGLCTILGHNAQTGYMRRYFNKIMKHNSKNATAIALNITDEHFDFTMTNVGESKVDKMMIEREFSTKAIHYCESLNACATKEKRVDFIEVKEGKIYGYCLDDEAKALFGQPEFLDDQILFVAKMMILASRWFDTKIDVDDIPLLIGEKNE
jgi:shikimate 5-dehydrogenase